MAKSKKKKRKQAATKKASRKTADSLINLKVSARCKARMEANAEKYTNGNLSRWIRLSGTAFEPSKRELSTLPI